MSYRDYWMDEGYDTRLRSIKGSLDNILSELSNSRRREVLAKAEEFPVLIYGVRPFKAGSTLARVSMYLLPVGIILRLLSLPFELRISNDLKNVQRLSGELNEVIGNGKEPAHTATA